MSLPINPTKCPRNLIAKAVEWMEGGQQIAMLTLVEIEGSAPYPLGTQMLVNEQGDYIGQITGGCAEAALALQAVEAIKNSQSKHQRYGLNSQFFDIQLPCGSGIDVFFDVSTSLSEYRELNDTLLNRESVDRYYAAPSGQMVKTFRPNERLIVCGQGPILHHLAELALATGFDVISMVPTKAASASALDDDAHQYVEIDKGLVELENYCDEFTALISLFHEHDYETELFVKTLDTPLFYIGALGSRATHRRRRGLLIDAGVDERKIERIHGPVGVDIKAETPAHIAVSILAQVIEHLAKPL